MPDEEERVGEGEGSKLEFELELEPAEEEGLAWPNTVEEAVVAGLVSLVREIGEKSEVRSRIEPAQFRMAGRTRKSSMVDSAPMLKERV
ncbi:MAG: hypothetical protein ALECFALPRED_002575 [Alectoria fallacina]|uniref:Uncharacterized protein n=1 Tax=Alectoria fallacina TaxID=1903189 RepID=A0A8H3FN04_9LECA|nr:MAG: hypothetical protein ALECFALPRED_002575 [Alectoria fallacina]